VAAENVPNRGFGRFAARFILRNQIRGHDWLVILLKVLARATTISGVPIADHDRFPTYYGTEFASKAMDA
jgi:hypothetical protein